MKTIQMELTILMQLPLYSIFFAPNLDSMSITKFNRDWLITNIIISRVIALSIDILEHLRGPISNNCTAIIKCEPAIINGASGNNRFDNIKRDITPIVPRQSVFSDEGRFFIRGFVHLRGIDVGVGRGASSNEFGIESSIRAIEMQAVAR